eukprot:9201516-Ditylum_brightwellii.AAC.1
MSQSGNDNDKHFESAVERKDDVSYNTVEDESELPKYLTDAPATRDALSEFYVDQESLEKGPGCNLDSEDEDVIDIDACRHTTEKDRRS